MAGAIHRCLPCGGCRWIAWLRLDKRAELVKLYVSPQARGSGTARDLLSYAEHLLCEQGVAEAELFCTAGNVRAQRFYAREGWRLSRSFEDALWLPDDVAGRFTVETHCYRKHLGFR
ncbi:MULTISPECIES: GNAT family N-acetyltransferase [Mesorhizobium]|uniref:GNAT family N-acetyltransferase n=1 Tax=Mesorhizobium ciceri TaxID=39645 RepID=A0AB38T1V4_9HYPH|nr:MULTISPECIES: GNAT family N-acetyltransferase [Mesorhizobium]MDF3212581.1 GNAT family N-acetyltransferase [Mesorhizobium ciceri]UTU49021.1 GNAT family N-acetyltransferase [Mesorhizobium ciceri]